VGGGYPTPCCIRVPLTHDHPTASTPAAYPAKPLLNTPPYSPSRPRPPHAQLLQGSGPVARLLPGPVARPLLVRLPARRVVRLRARHLRAECEQGSVSKCEQGRGRVPACRMVGACKEAVHKRTRWGVPGLPAHACAMPDGGAGSGRLADGHWFVVRLRSCNTCCNTCCKTIYEFVEFMWAIGHAGSMWMRVGHMCGGSITQKSAVGGAPGSPRMCGRGIPRYAPVMSRGNGHERGKLQVGRCGGQTSAAWVGG
jgi:hypothetical protein